MIDLFETAVQLQPFCDRRGWRSCFIGGIAVQRWGEPRVTLCLVVNPNAIVPHCMSHRPRVRIAHAEANLKPAV